MPIYRKGKGNWVKHCDRCGKPFIKREGVRQKRCQNCTEELRSLHGKSIIRNNVPIFKRMIHKL